MVRQVMRQQARGRARACDGDADGQRATGRGAAQLRSNRLPVAEQPREPAHIERHLSRSARLDARREIARDLHQHIGRVSFRSIYSGKHFSNLPQPSLARNTEAPRHRVKLLGVSVSGGSSQWELLIKAGTGTFPTALRAGGTTRPGGTAPPT